MKYHVIVNGNKENHQKACDFFSDATTTLSIEDYVLFFFVKTS